MKTFLKKINNIQNIKSIQPIQDLWSNYGKLLRVNTDEQPIIVKMIKFPKEINNFSHKRKVRSYEVEKYWYQNYQPTKDYYFPNHIDQGEIDQTHYLILEDLALSGFISQKRLNQKQIKDTLKWLANFHAHFMGVKDPLIWPIGGYWHLDTRPEELEKIVDLDLKQKASLIDKKLKNARYQTVVHGDAKLANFLYSQNSVAAVDFQYIGHGPGIKDVIYFMSSIFESTELKEQEENCLKVYFHYLKQALPLSYKDQFKSIEIEYRNLYPYAWADFYRFLKGWSPEHKKINPYTTKITQKVLSWL